MHTETQTRTTFRQALALASVPGGSWGQGVKLIILHCAHASLQNARIQKKGAWHSSSCIDACSKLCHLVLRHGVDERDVQPVRQCCAGDTTHLNHKVCRVLADMLRSGFRREKARLEGGASGTAVAYQSGHCAGRLQESTRRPKHPAHTRVWRGSAIEHGNGWGECSPQPRPSPHPCPAHPYSAARLAAGVV